ncbi:MAG: hypothetical protein ACPH63_07770 [Flavobacteriaceae bacterium]
MITVFYEKRNLVSYVLSLLMLTAAVYYHQTQTESTFLFWGEKSITVLLLAFCLYATDWTVKRQYWAKNSNYHLLVFPLLFFGLPVSSWNNWMLLYIAFFWVAMNYVLGLSRSNHKMASVFNAGFLLCFGALFYPKGLFFFPVLWVTMAFYSLLSAQLFLISLLPFIALILLGVCFRYAFPSTPFFSWPVFSFLDVQFIWQEKLRLNLWWLVFIFILVSGTWRHLAYIRSKSATYVSGLFTLLFCGFSGLLFALLFQTDSTLAWVLLLMVMSALSTRLFEEFKKGWIRELFFLFLLLLIIASKDSFFLF